MRVKAHIYRADPGANEGPEYRTYEIEADPEETVSGLLQYIYEIVDPTLAFRFVCNMQKCGECSIMVNKAPCLACEKRVEPEMTLDPLPNLPIIKDLVIDRYKVISNIFKIAPFLKGPNPSDGGEIEHAGITETSITLGKCLGCLICQAVCPALKDNPGRFIGPLGLLWLVQKRTDGPEESDSWYEEKKRSLELCDYCGKCWNVCPDQLNILACAFEQLEPNKKRKRAPQTIESHL